MHGGSMSDQASPDQDIVRASREREDPDRNDRGIKVAYAAGFFDGEGWVSIQTHKTQQPFVVIGAGQKTPEPLRLLQGLWGNSINRAKDDIWRWRLTGKRACEALREMRDLLIVKQGQADVAIEFHEGLAPRPKRWADAKERAREGTRRYRARKRGEAIETPKSLSRLTPETYARAQEYRRKLYSSRP